ncbi:MAG: molecular chaperone HtpG [Candidatus Cloacimonas sp.]|nr:molecular chaperone HtpG [Candidatus Cloacimonadota bacterium]
MSDKKKTEGQLSIHTENIFPIIKKWLYSEHDIFSRELISNAIDAMQKRKVVDASVNEDDLKIEIKINKKKRTLEFIDYGIGMTAEEIEKYINQIAFSGAEEFVEKYKDKQSSIIGHFGLGFYSAFMVAERVTIDSLSWQEGAEPAFWECDGSTSYTIDIGKRKKVGTTITLHLNKDSDEYLDFTKMRELIEKYSNFTPFPIVMDKKVINQKRALWNSKPTELKDEEYKQFYKDIFHDFNDPLFWIHLNVDYPFNLKGILYFPKVRNQLDLQRGVVKLYCNNVYVADNLQEFIPEFLLLLRGGIDIPDIPLNVSRSFLQQDQNVKKISKYIIKKVADYLNDLFKEDRKKYEQYWEDIHQFLKFGAISEESFYEAVKDIILFKNSDNEFVTLGEYRERNKDDKDVLKVLYASGEDSQSSYLKMMKELGKEVIYADTLIDNHLFQKIEMVDDKTTFSRVDSELSDELVNKEHTEILDADNKSELDILKEIFEKGLDNTNVKVDVKRLKDKEIPGLVIFNEFMRRMQEMNSIYANQQDDLLAHHDFVVNADNKIVKKLIKLNATGKDKEVSLLTKHLHSLSLLEQKNLSGKQLQEFLDNARKVLELI